MNRERIEQLAKHLEGVPQKYFDMHTWANFSVHNKPACGTAACIAGHACTIFPELELRKSISSDSLTVWNTQSESWGTSALAAALDMEYFRTMEITHSSVKTPAEAAALLRRMIHEA